MDVLGLLVLVVDAMVIAGLVREGGVARGRTTWAATILLLPVIGVALYYMLRPAPMET